VYAYDGTAHTQFLSRDPAVAVTREPYGYGNENQLNRADPSGLDDWWADPPGPWAGDFWQHYCDHASDFGLEGDPEGYYSLTKRTIDSAMNGDIPVKRDPSTGAYAAYDQTSGRFVKFRPEGTPITCMKQSGSAGRAYWNDQAGTTTCYPEDQVEQGLRPRPPQPESVEAFEGGFGGMGGVAGPSDAVGGSREMED
jgi:hypothetical protein